MVKPETGLRGLLTRLSKAGQPKPQTDRQVVVESLKALSYRHDAHQGVDIFYLPKKEGDCIVIVTETAILVPEKRGSLTINSSSLYKLRFILNTL